MFKFENVSKHKYMKHDKPSTGNLFITVRGGNEHQTPYLIISGGEKKYSLLNMHSHQMNYSADTIDELLEGYFERNRIGGLNPVTSYFFSRGFKAEIDVYETFGWTETGFTKGNPAKKAMQISQQFNSIKAKEIMDNAFDKNNK